MIVRSLYCKIFTIFARITSTLEVTVCLGAYNRSRVLPRDYIRAGSRSNYRVSTSAKRPTNDVADVNMIKTSLHQYTERINGL